MPAHLHKGDKTYSQSPNSKDLQVVVMQQDVVIFNIVTTKTHVSLSSSSATHSVLHLVKKYTQKKGTVTHQWF